MDLVDKLGVKRLTKDIPAAFNQHAGDFTLTEFGQNARERSVTIDKRAISRAVREKMRSRWQFARPAEHYTPWLAHTPNSTSGEARIILAQSFRSDQNRIHFQA
jgi:hypothetical protein